MNQTLQPRNFSPQEMFIRMAQNHAPECAFTRHPGPFEKWKSETLPRVLATLGESPTPVDPNPELIAEWEDRDVVKRRYWIDVGPHISVPLQVNLPKQHDAGKQPTLLCWHGHGEFGKDAVMGVCK